MLGFSLYPHHLRGGSDCTLRDFCEMIARTAEVMGVERLGIGSDLCQDQPDSVVEWMRVGRWTKRVDYGEGSADAPGFPPQPDFFRDNRDFPAFAPGWPRSAFPARRCRLSSVTTGCGSSTKVSGRWHERIARSRSGDAAFADGRVLSHASELHARSSARAAAWRMAGRSHEWDVDGRGVGHAVYRVRGRDRPTALSLSPTICPTTCGPTA
jgi:hypothetical protein